VEVCGNFVGREGPAREGEINERVHGLAEGLSGREGGKRVNTHAFRVGLLQRNRNLGVNIPWCW